jgi:hypothetical protein
VKRWLDLWNAYWFPRTTSLSLAGARIVAVSAQLFWFFPSLQHHLNLATKNSHFTHPQALIRLVETLAPREAVFTAAGLTAIYWVTATAGMTALIGLFTRTSLFIFALGVWFFVSHGYSYGDVHHTQAVFAIVLLTLAFAPAGHSLSVDALLRRRRAGGRLAPGGAERLDTAMWPLKLAHVLLAMTYFSTGITKLLCCGLTWMNGYTLQNHLFGDAIEHGNSLGIWLAQQHTLCIFLAIGTIAFELFFFISLILPRTAPYFFLGGILFHASLYVTAGHPFFEHITLNALLLLFLDPDWFAARLRRLTGRQPAALQARQEA